MGEENVTKEDREYAKGDKDDEEEQKRKETRERRIKQERNGKKSKDIVKFKDVFRLVTTDSKISLADQKFLRGHSAF